MPIFTPINPERVEEARAYAFANDILAASADPNLRSLAHSQEEINAIMEECGIGIRATLQNLAHIQKFGGSEHTRLKAIDKSLDILGLTGKRRDDGKDTKVNIIIANTNGAPLTKDIFNPQRVVNS